MAASSGGLTWESMEEMSFEDLLSIDQKGIGPFAQMPPLPDFGGASAPPRGAVAGKGNKGAPAGVGKPAGAGATGPTAVAGKPAAGGGRAAAAAARAMRSRLLAAPQQLRGEAWCAGSEEGGTRHAKPANAVTDPPHPSLPRGAVRTPQRQEQAAAWRGEGEASRWCARRQGCGGASRAGTARGVGGRGRCEEGEFPSKEATYE